jgi:hypothetical protein
MLNIEFEIPGELTWNILSSTDMYIISVMIKRLNLNIKRL